MSGILAIWLLYLFINRIAIRFESIIIIEYEFFWLYLILRNNRVCSVKNRLGGSNFNLLIFGFFHHRVHLLFVFGSQLCDVFEHWSQFSI